MFKPAVLFFNIAQDSRCAKMEAFLSGRGVLVRHVAASEFGLPLGALLSLPGFSLVPGASAVPFYEEMLLMSGFDDQLLQEFLAFFTLEGVRRVALKAMLTPTNASWNASELHRHLSAEHAQFQKMKK